ncbi:hypothetical protein AAES_53119 [Amazona aestiva]|uniref:Uncharacterized protein n=1 Tax=Amazona aestiva TaxID=12930 RepID=A0A0Q3UTI8_AMAAE|nr:hypothetical protein AAES_53119 [Amazona aestiva]
MKSLSSLLRHFTTVMNLESNNQSVKSGNYSRVPYQNPSKSLELGFAYPCGEELFPCFTTAAFLSLASISLTLH